MIDLGRALCLCYYMFEYESFCTARFISNCLLLLCIGHRCSCRRRSSHCLRWLQAPISGTQAPILHLQNRKQEDDQDREVWGPLKDLR